MSEAKFTKGEWKVCNDSIAVIDSSDSQSFGMPMEVCWIEASFCESIYEQKANAHLIAAAPEMYEEIERDIAEIESRLQFADKRTLTTNPDVKRLERKKSLLAKARGESR